MAVASSVAVIFWARPRAADGEAFRSRVLGAGPIIEFGLLAMESLIRAVAVQLNRLVSNDVQTTALTCKVGPRCVSSFSVAGIRFHNSYIADIQYLAWVRGPRLESAKLGPRVG